MLHGRVTLGEKKQHFTARISESLVTKINNKAKERNTTVTAIVEEAFNKYFYNTVPGLCPSCHTQNLPDSQYCQKCGEPITGDESLRKYVKRLEMRIEQLERMVQVGKIAYENKELILKHKGDEKN